MFNTISNINNTLLYALLIVLIMLPSPCTAEIQNLAGTKAVTKELNNNKVMVIKFSASLCPACRAMNSIDQKIEAEFVNTQKQYKNTYTIYVKECVFYRVDPFPV